MSFRFRKSIRLGKGVRLNVSKSGIGVSAGTKGARVGIGPRGTRVTTSIPGTGIGYEHRSKKKTGTSAERSQPTPTASHSQAAPKRRGILARFVIGVLKLALWGSIVLVILAVVLALRG